VVPSTSRRKRHQDPLLPATHYDLTAGNQRFARAWTETDVAGAGEASIRGIDWRTDQHTASAPRSWMDAGDGGGKGHLLEGRIRGRCRTAGMGIGERGRHPDRTVEPEVSPLR
jgi:hypothetical protein